MHTLLVLNISIIAGFTLLLGLWTSLVRGQSKAIYHGADRDPASSIAKAQRAHGNASEYAGILIGLFIATGLIYQDRDLGLAITLLVSSLTIARLIHAFGFLTCKSLDQINVFKAIGALITYVAGTALAIMLVLKAL